MIPKYVYIKSAHAILLVQVRSDPPLQKIYSVYYSGHGVQGE